MEALSLCLMQVSVPLQLRCESQCIFALKDAHERLLYVVFISEERDPREYSQSRNIGVHQAENGTKYDTCFSLCMTCMIIVFRCD